MQDRRTFALLLAFAIAAVTGGATGCADDPDVPVDDDDLSADPPEVVVVADGLYGDEPTRHSAQERLVALGDGVLLAVFGDGVEGAPDGYVATWAVVSLDGGGSWEDPQRVTPDEGVERLSAATVAARTGQVVLVFPGLQPGMDASSLFAREGSWSPGDEYVSWDEARSITGFGGRGYSSPDAVLGSDGRFQLISPRDSPYDDACAPDVADCPQEERHVYHLRQSGTGQATTTRQISERWTSTVPELAWDGDGGIEGASGLGRLWAVWHNEDRPAQQLGCVVGHLSLWSDDLDQEQDDMFFTVEGVPDTWEGEPCDADIQTALHPSLAVDELGNPHVVYAHVDGAGGMVVHYTARGVDGSWSPPEPVNDWTRPWTDAASVVLRDGAEPRVVGTRAEGDGGVLVVAAREDGGWRERVLAWSETPIRWANVSDEPVVDGRFGVLFGSGGGEAGDGALYFTTLPP